MLGATQRVRNMILKFLKIFFKKNLRMLKIIIIVTYKKFKDNSVRFYFILF